MRSLEAHPPRDVGFDDSLYSDEEDEVIRRLLLLCAPSDLRPQSHDFVSKWVEAEAFAASLDSPEGDYKWGRVARRRAGREEWGRGGGGGSVVTRDYAYPR